MAQEKPWTLSEFKKKKYIFLINPKANDLWIFFKSSPNQQKKSVHIARKYRGMKETFSAEMAYRDLYLPSVEKGYKKLTGSKAEKAYLDFSQLLYKN